MDSHPSSSPVPVPQMLGYGDVPTAVESLIDAFTTDPLQSYLLHTPDAKDTVLHRASRRVEFGAFFASLVNKQGAWTINGGESVVGYTQAKESKTGRDWTDLYDWLSPWAFSYKKILFSTEQEKRSKECVDKIKKAVTATLGPKEDATMYLAIAATARAKQGLGYGSTLIKLVTAKADEQARPMWLMSSNSVNIPFYNSFGFEVKADIILGDDNPTWDEPPIVMALMVREPVPLKSDNDTTQVDNVPVTSDASV